MKSSLLVLVTLIGFVYGNSLHLDQHPNPLSDETINRINSLGTTWKAGRNFNPNEIESVKRRLGSLPTELKDKSFWDLFKPKPKPQKKKFNLPKSFDAREAWPNCTSLFTIRDEGNCGSSYAFSAVDAISDRLCIHKSIDVLLSAQQIITCYGDGCQVGSWPENVYMIYAEEGIVTGGLYGGGGCLPYTIPPCDHYINGSLPTCYHDYDPTPECKKECVPGYGKTFEEDKFYGQPVYRLESDPEEIMNDIMTDGPVSSGMVIYEDFLNYKSGVYQATTKETVGGHAVRIIGWGTENGTDYWLIANSWNANWGDKGYFKIKRGNNECGIEERVYASLPKP